MVNKPLKVSTYLKSPITIWQIIILVTIYTTIVKQLAMDVVWAGCSLKTRELVKMLAMDVHRAGCSLKTGACIIGYRLLS